MYNYLFLIHKDSCITLTKDDGLNYATPGLEIKLNKFGRIVCIDKVSNGWLFIKYDILSRIKKITFIDKFKIRFSNNIKKNEILNITNNIKYSSV